jgi:tetraacyldisaccharide 4'-kinase
MGEGTGGEGVRVAARAGLPILRAQLEPLRRRGLKQHPYLAFAGIADPKKFYASLTASGAEIGYTMDFPDHHWFSGVECEQILAHAKRRELVPITTEKDRVRLLGRDGAVERLAQATETFPVRARFAEPQRLTALIADAVAGYSDAYRRRVKPNGAETVPA